MNYWITQAGKTIAYKDIDDNHLLNILSFIKRQAKEGVEIIDNIGYGDLDYIENNIQTICGKEVLEYFDYNDLKKEAKKRGLKERKI